MTVEAALRKIRLLRRVVTGNGASEGEARAAARLAGALMERYSIRGEDVQPIGDPFNRMTWVYWDQMLEEFGLVADHIGGRANAEFGDGLHIVIRLQSGQWQVQQRSPQGWKIAAQGEGLKALRKYLTRNTPRTDSLVR